MIVYLTIAAAFFGLGVGSFLMVLVHRVPERKSILNWSPHCVHCLHPLALPDVIPIFSYFALHCRCRYCREPISLQYPLIEALTAILFASAVWRFGCQPELFVALLMASLLLVAAVIDLNLRIIPNRITYFGMIAIALLRVWIHPLPIWQYGLAFFLGGGLLYGIARCSKGGMGGGDMKLVALVGLFLGPVLLGLAIFCSCLLGILYGAGMLVIRRGQRKSTLPFGPFIALGTWFAYVFGELLLQGYSQWLQRFG